MVRSHPHLLNPRPRPASLLRLRPVSVISVARELLEPEEEEDRLWQSRTQLGRVNIINMNSKLYDYGRILINRDIQYSEEPNNIVIDNDI